MKKFLILLLLFFSSKIIGEELESGKWNFVADDEYCYIGSFPVETDLPEGKKRGETFILVYRMNKSPDAIVQIDAGYPYNVDKPVEVKIDKKVYDFYSVDDSAWARDDKKIISEMKRGLTLSVKGISLRGTQTIDTYTLKGFTSAFNKLSKGC